MKLKSISKTAAVTVFATLMVMAATAFGIPVKSLVTEQAVSTAGSGSRPIDGGWTDVYGSKVVYREQNSTGDYDVWMFDSATGASKRIASSTLDEHFPRIYGDYVVYNRDYAGVYLYRISTGKTKTIASSGVRSLYVDIYKDKVVYSKYSTVTKSLDVYVYDIDTGKETKVVSSKDSSGKYGDDRVQGIWGSNVVYVVNSKDLRAYNLTTKKSVSFDAQGFSVNADYADAGVSRPAIYQNTVVYVASTSGYNQVFTYDLASKVRTQVSQDATTHANPAIYGTRIVYERGSIGNPHFVLHDMRAKSSWELNIGKAMLPSIWGDRIGWNDLRNATLNGDEIDEGVNWGNEDVYTGTIDTLRIAISGPKTVGYKTPAAYTATVTNPDGSSVGTGTDISFEISTDAVNWTPLASGQTAGGTFSATMPAVTSKRYVRFWYGGRAATPGNPGAPATVSSVLTVSPKVSLGTPVAPKTMKAKKGYTVYGSLKPKHTSGTKPVRIYKYKKVSGKWKSYGYVKATASNYSTYTRYKVKMSLPSKGSWRLRAYAPADSKHAATWSSKYDYVTVK